MARNLFGGTADSVAEDITGARVPNAVGSVWDGPSAGAARITDLTDISGAPILQLQADANGFVSAFYGPDGYERLWVDFGAGRVALVSVTVGERLDAHIAGFDAHGDRAYSDAQLAAHNSNTKVHGLTGDAVGTTDTQTLTNKTLNGGTLNGTFAGTPTLSGAPSLTAGANVSGGSVTVTRSQTTNPGLNYQVTGDSTPRLTVQADGLMKWGPGNAATDTQLYRNGINVLKTDGSFVASGLTSSTNGASSALVASTTADGTASTGVVVVNPSSATKRAVDIRLSSDTVSRLRIDQSAGSGSGTITFGNGTVADTNLYRSAASTLTTDGAFTAGGDISAGATTWTNFTPTWSGLGSGTFSTNVGWYKKLGKLVYVEIYGVINAAGTGTTGVAVQFPTAPYRDGAGANTTRQHLTGFISGSNAGVIDGMCILPALAGDSGVTGATIRRYDWIAVQGSNFITNTVITIQGWYREA
ncbi:hypothetical protein [Streptomyces argyrophylli]|uniref:hypothetical protein n=1 Tax=Streptomyces argyrophylli TaxID=2726118 RepID=UPI001BB13B14|nr:hypothetical protein [Streptomyces argyrophyllae]